MPFTYLRFCTLSYDIVRLCWLATILRWAALKRFTSSSVDIHNFCFDHCRGWVHVMVRLSCSREFLYSSLHVFLCVLSFIYILKWYFVIVIFSEEFENLMYFTFYFQIYACCMSMSCTIFLIILTNSMINFTFNKFLLSKKCFK